MLLSLILHYPGPPSVTQYAIGVFYLLMVVLIPLIVLAVVLHRLPLFMRLGLDLALIGFLFLWLILPIVPSDGPTGTEKDFLVAVVALAAGLDLLRLGKIWKAVGAISLGLSFLIAIGFLEPALQHVVSEYGLRFYP